MPRELLMKWSFYEDMLEAVREEGREEGRKEGRKEAEREGEKELLRRLCNVVLKLRLDELPPEAERISSIEEVDHLERLADALEQAPDPAAVRAALLREVGG
jgi:predicted transposase YdaD